MGELDRKVDELQRDMVVVKATLPHIITTWKFLGVMLPVVVLLVAGVGWMLSIQTAAIDAKFSVALQSANLQLEKTLTDKLSAIEDAVSSGVVIEAHPEIFEAGLKSMEMRLSGELAKLQDKDVVQGFNWLPFYSASVWPQGGNGAPDSLTLVQDEKVWEALLGGAITDGYKKGAVKSYDASTFGVLRNGTFVPFEELILGAP